MVNRGQSSIATQVGDFLQMVTKLIHFCLICLYLAQLVNLLIELMDLFY